MTVEKKYIVALDQGTTSSRAVVLDHDANIVAVSQREFPQIYPKAGWVEHDPMEIWASQSSTLVEVLAKADINSDQIAGIGITNQRETTVVWNRHTGVPVHNAIVWQDRRTEGMCAELRERGLEPAIHQKTGLVVDPYFSAVKLKWILDNTPGARQSAQAGDLLFGTVDSWLLWKLTGGRLHATDVSNASRTMLWNIHTRAWDPQLLDWLGVPESMLPAVHPSSHVYGDIDATHLGSPIVVGGMAGDQQAALFGQACFEPGMAKNTYGTGCFMLMNTGDKAVVSRNGLLTTLAWGIEGKVEYALEGSIFVAGSVVQWLRDGLRMFGKSSDCQAYAERAADNGGVYLVPAFVGLGAPYWRSDVRGAMFGITRGTRKEHFIRAAVESMAYQTRDVLAAMQADAGIELKELRADGGAIGNDFMAQFQSDILGVPVVRPQVAETTALGAAYLAGLAMGFWGSRDEIAAQWAVDRRFMPQMAVDQREALYAGWQQAVQATMGFRVG